MTGTRRAKQFGKKNIASYCSCLNAGAGCYQWKTFHIPGTNSLYSLPAIAQKPVSYLTRALARGFFAHFTQASITIARTQRTALTREILVPIHTLPALYSLHARLTAVKRDQENIKERILKLALSH